MPPTALRIVQLNLAYDAALPDCGTLLDRYHTLTGLSRALLAAGAKSGVVQRFRENASVTLEGIRYQFVSDGGREMPPPSWRSREVIDTLRAETPDVVHVNGLMFPRLVREIREAMPGVRVVMQDHAGARPPGGIRRLRDRVWGDLSFADAWSFTAAEHASAWRGEGLLGHAHVFEILEASTTLEPIPRSEAARLTGIHGAPSLLWVGRLNANKDPLTVLRAIDLALHEIDDARLWMVYGDAPLESEVRAFIEHAPRLHDRVTLVGHVPHAEMARYYSAVDFFVSGSHHEGSGYALIEAMCCDAVPLVTDIPSFRAITGPCGTRWRAGNARSFADALITAARGDLDAESARVRERFERVLSWKAIGRQTVDAYRTLL